MEQITIWKKCKDHSNPEGCTRRRREAERVRQATVMSKRKSSGVCVRCGAELPDTTGTTCSTCLDKRKKYRNIELERNWRATNQDKLRELHWRNRGIVGMTVALYNRMLVEQDGRCYLCRDKPSGNRKLVVDHNHSTHIPRRLLCDVCNTALERLENHNGWEARARAYLKEFAE